MSTLDLEDITELQAKLEKDFQEITNNLDGLNFNDDNFSKLSKKLKSTTTKLNIIQQYLELRTEAESLQNMISDPSYQDFLEVAKNELKENQEKLSSTLSQLTEILNPGDPLDDSDVLLEIRAGAGGAEASLFATELAEMYTIFCQRQGFDVKEISSSESELGGIKEKILEITGEKVYGLLKYESGVHRVQRIPKTESNGRIHTSTVTVAILPISDEVVVEIKPEDLRIDVYRSSGNGGQSVNTTDSAVRITHLPTGIVVTCQDEKSQLKNKLKAMKVLQAKLSKLEIDKQNQNIGDLRSSQIGSADRSEKIRTYNFGQDRITDHRINFSVYGTQKFLSGSIDEMLNAVKNHSALQ